MAAFNDVYKVAFYNWQPPQQAVNVTHWRVAAVQGEGLSDLDIANAFHAGFKEVYKLWMPTTASFLGVEVQKISPGAIGPLVQSTGSITPGQIESEPLPYQVAALLRVQTKDGGRSGRGRIYLPFWTENSNSPTGDLTAGAQLLVAGAAAVFTGPFQAGFIISNGVTFFSGVWSQVQSLFHDTLVVTGRSQWATIRRRSRIGRNDTPIRNV